MEGLAPFAVRLLAFVRLAQEKGDTTRYMKILLHKFNDQHLDIRYPLVIRQTQIVSGRKRLE